MGAKKTMEVSRSLDGEGGEFFVRPSSISILVQWQEDTMT